MSACRPLIICKQNILKHILSAFIGLKIKEMHIFEYSIAKFCCFFGVAWQGDLFRNVNVTGRHLVMLGDE